MEKIYNINAVWNKKEKKYCRLCTSNEGQTRTSLVGFLPTVEWAPWGTSHELMCPEVWLFGAGPNPVWLEAIGLSAGSRVSLSEAIFDEVIQATSWILWKGFLWFWCIWKHGDDVNLSLMRLFRQLVGSHGDIGIGFALIWSFLVKILLWKKLWFSHTLGLSRGIRILIRVGLIGSGILLMLVLNSCNLFKLLASFSKKIVVKMKTFQRQNLHFSWYNNKSINIRNQTTYNYVLFV